MKSIIASLSLACLLLIGGTASAQEAGSILLQNSAEMEELYTDDSGVQRVRRVPVSKVVPGDEVIYTITFTNTSDEVAENIVITNPLAAELTYVEGSAFGPGTTIEFSVDGGVSYAAASELTVSEDGEVRPARPEDFTHIRWVMHADLQAGAQGLARFRARLD